MENTAKKERLLRLQETKQRTGLSTSTLYAQMSEGRFPGSIMIGDKSVAWIESEIDRWIEHRIAQTRAATLIK